MNTIRSKKGFTITELVIVIVVIAILAAVLIPTFVSLINKANLSADQQAVRQMNTILAAEEVTDKPSNVTEAKDILIANGISDFAPTFESNIYYWVGADNRVLLWTADEEDANKGSVTFPKESVKRYKDVTEPSADWADLSLDYNVQVISAAEGESLSDALMSAIDNAADGEILKLPANSTVSLSGMDSYSFATKMKHDGGVGKSLTIDLNGSTLTSNEKFIYNGTDYGYYGLTIPANGSLVLSNGNLEITTDAAHMAAMTAKTGAHVILRDLKYTSNGSLLYPSGTASEFVVEDCQLSTTGTFGIATNGANSNVSRVVVRNSNLQANMALCFNTDSDVHIEGSTIIGKGWGMLVRVGHIDVVDSTIKTTNGDVGTQHGYKNFAWTQNSRGVPHWGTSNQVPYGVVVVGDYYGRDAYVGEACVDLHNVKLESPNAADVPQVIYSAQLATDIVTFNYDDATAITNDVVYGKDYSKDGVTHTFVHNGEIKVNGVEKTLE